MASAVELLGPKGAIYFDLARESWLGPLERSSARRALLIGFLGIVMVITGVLTARVVFGESIILVPVGLFALWHAWEELKPLAVEFRDARRIGWVELSLDDGWATLGEPVTCRITVHARRALVPRTASLELVATGYTGTRATGELSRMVIAVPSLPASVRGGDDLRTSVTFRMPDDVPASWYTATESRRWTLTARLDFDDAAPWTRSYPLLVYPPPEAAWVTGRALSATE